jgi:hypothetical protein
MPTENNLNDLIAANKLLTDTYKKAKLTGLIDEDYLDNIGTAIILLNRAMLELSINRGKAD